MHYRALFILQALVLFAVGAIHIAALHWSLYWRFVWLDTPVHFLGGVWLALASSWIFLQWRRDDLSVAAIFSAVALGSIAWELFEVGIGIPREANFLFDTVVDLTMDMSGGIFGFLIAKWFSQRGTIRQHEAAQNDPS